MFRCFVMECLNPFWKINFLGVRRTRRVRRTLHEGGIDEQPEVKAPEGRWSDASRPLLHV